jgi:hypothetical protein
MTGIKGVACNEGVLSQCIGLRVLFATKGGNDECNV